MLLIQGAMSAVVPRTDARSRLFWFWVFAGTFICAGFADFSSAHQFGVQNGLDDSVLMECRSALRGTGPQTLWPGRRFVFGWNRQPPVPENWMCGFVWLNTTFVKQVSVWSYIVGVEKVCDVCEWRVMPEGFELSKGCGNNRTGFAFVHGWDEFCLSP